MRKTALQIKKVRINGDTFWQVTAPKQEGGRLRRTFKEKGKAQTFHNLQKIQLQNHGTAALSISEGLRVMATGAERALAPYGKTIRDAVEFYVAHLRAVNSSKQVREVVSLLLKAKEADGLSARHTRDLRERLGRFADAFGGRAIADIAVMEIDAWLRSLGVSGLTRNGYRTRLSNLFSFALANQWITENPIASVSKAKEAPAECGILTPQQAAKLLEVASVETLPYWAIGAFAGLRSAELARLDWADVDLDGGSIEIKAANAKTQSRRLIPLTDNLRAWLTPYAGASGPVCPVGLRKRTEADRDRAGLRKWPSNALRHSFGSYRLAAVQNAAQVSLEMGNSPAMVFRHYRELVKPKAAALWWNISPAPVANVVSMKA